MLGSGRRARPPQEATIALGVARLLVRAARGAERGEKIATELDKGSFIEGEQVSM
jgi:hypothetical protein